MLDIGCGEGLLIQRLLPFAAHVVGVDPDERAIAQSEKRLGTSDKVTLLHGDFLDMPIPSGEERFTSITCVAVLHHMDLSSALLKMRECLAPGGRMIVIGLAADQSILDFIIAGLSYLPIRVMDWLHGGVQEIDVKIASPKESFQEIRNVARELLPGAKITRRFYYRYVLTWEKGSP